MYDYLIDAIGAFWRYGASPTALVVALVALFKTKHFKRFIGRRAPWLFKDDSDVLNYQSRQIRIESKIDALMSAGGVSWDVASVNGKNALNPISGLQKRSLLQQVAYAPVTIARYFTPLKGTYHSQQRRMRKMSKLLSRKFLMAVLTSIFIALNDALEWGFSETSITSIVTVIVGWIAIEGTRDVVASAKKKPEVSAYDAKTLDSVRSDSEGA